MRFGFRCGRGILPLKDVTALLTVSPMGWVVTLFMFAVAPDLVYGERVEHEKKPCGIPARPLRDPYSP